ncbi:MAG: hypothetical protein AWT59_2365 [Candidatus Gallionella acididurans]|uniref:Uncharacterized protein n=1 Tax=Candidatus Gallionella acididurans TaxID=1796491 RepID=A0A139BRE4_9PROT|nr:MAG: hypothetical protein AWT59_2365 [Candidatus Gallionella acididurans]
MSKHTKDNSAPNEPAYSRQTIRLFVDVTGTGWKAIGGTRGLAVPRDVLYLPEFAGRVIRVALANIKVEKRKPVALNRLSIENWKIGDDGNADQEDQLRHVVARMKGEASDSATSNPTDADIGAIERCLGISSA